MHYSSIPSRGRGPFLRGGRRTLALAAVVLALAQLNVEARAQGADESPLAGLSWLAGCWEAQRGGMVIEEQWMEPRGAVMLGMSRTVVNGRVREYEHISIHADSAGVVYVATPSRQARTEFRMSRNEPGVAAFANPEHDFPQLISYQAAAAGDSLIATISGQRGGAERSLTFPYARVACAGDRDRREQPPKR